MSCNEEFPCDGCVARGWPAVRDQQSPQVASTIVFSLLELHEMRCWVQGIEKGIWNPTPSTKRYLARMFSRILKESRVVEREDLDTQHL